jgi:hypothetical protein
MDMGERRQRSLPRGSCSVVTHGRCKVELSALSRIYHSLCLETFLHSFQQMTFTAVHMCTYSGGPIKSSLRYLLVRSQSMDGLGRKMLCLVLVQPGTAYYCAFALLSSIVGAGSLVLWQVDRLNNLGPLDLLLSKHFLQCFVLVS